MSINGPGELISSASAALPHGELVSLESAALPPEELISSASAALSASSQRTTAYKTDTVAQHIAASQITYHSDYGILPNLGESTQVEDMVIDKDPAPIPSLTQRHIVVYGVLLPAPVVGYGQLPPFLDDDLKKLVGEICQGKKEFTPEVKSEVIVLIDKLNNVEVMSEKERKGLNDTLENLKKFLNKGSETKTARERRNFNMRDLSFTAASLDLHLWTLIELQGGG